MDIDAYIKENWVHSIRDGAPKGLPFPFTSPSCERTSDVGFENFFYWDTYFTDLGLLLDGMAGQAKNNIKNCAYLIDKYGYVPNVATAGGDNRSQMPLFILMCHAYFRLTGESEFFRAMYPAMEKEYAFWMRERTTPIGLNRYGNNADDATLVAFYEVIAGARIGEDGGGESKKTLGSHLLAEAESGWDFTPRFSRRAENFAPIDLNSILYENERILAAFAPDAATAKRYTAAADARKRRIETYCLSGGVYCDYDFVHDTRSATASAAQLFPYLCGLSDDGEGAARVLARLETNYGVVPTAKTGEDGRYQWAYPNIWPPLQYFAVAALDRVGRKEDALRIAKKYLQAVSKTADETGRLWEKYDADTGAKATVHEYSESEMLGWTAGTYQALSHYIRHRTPAHDFTV